jgi:peptidoglycan lytic transglycosylase D
VTQDTFIMKSVVGPTAVRLSWDSPETGRETEIFTESFKIGREEECQIVLIDEVVSKQHLEIYPSEEGWWVRDLESMNGTYLNDERIQHALISKNSKVRIAPDGPIIDIELINQEKTEVTLAAPEPGAQPEAQPALEHRPETVPDLSAEDDLTKPEESVTQVLEKYTSDEPAEDVGPHTLVMRQAFDRAKKIGTKRYRIIIAAAAVLLVIVISIVIYQHLRLKKLIQMGADIFYDMKAMEVQVEQLLESVVRTGETTQLEKLAAQRQQLEEMKHRYESYVEETGIMAKYSSAEDQQIFKIARLFGECELNMPEEFLEEVKSYIEKWKTTSRLRAAIRRVVENDYASRVFKVMIADHLPPQFMYIALQESDFKPRAVGPKTRFGIAKGFWQFIPTTAAQYGLQTGPLVELQRYDPRDERFDFDKATIAAAKYLRYIYNTEAQASGLLVVASYNWGQNNVRRLLRKMPENPRSRNFWKLLETKKIPKETYDYVLYIVSAAVIGENPKLFGFDFENPIDGLDEPT